MWCFVCTRARTRLLCFRRSAPIPVPTSKAPAPRHKRPLTPPYTPSPPTLAAAADPPGASGGGGDGDGDGAGAADESTASLAAASGDAHQTPTPTVTVTPPSSGSSSGTSSASSSKDGSQVPHSIPEDEAPGAQAQAQAQAQARVPKFNLKDIKQIGQYVVGFKLGQGAFGVVREGTHKITGEVVALKLINKTTISKDYLKKHIYREPQILQRLYVQHATPPCLRTRARSLRSAIFSPIVLRLSLPPGTARHRCPHSLPPTAHGLAVRALVARWFCADGMLTALACADTTPTSCS